MTEPTSPAGSLALAIAALLLVLGYRLALPSRAREWLALAAYAVALSAQTLGALGLIGGGARDVGVGLRVAGAGLLVAGILVAGAPARARRRIALGGAPPPRAPAARTFDPVYAGLALILVGQLLRAPSRAGVVSVAAAVLVSGWVALTPRRNGGASEASLR